MLNLKQENKIVSVCLINYGTGNLHRYISFHIKKKKIKIYDLKVIHFITLSKMI